MEKYVVRRREGFTHLYDVFGPGGEDIHNGTLVATRRKVAEFTYVRVLVKGRPEVVGSFTIEGTRIDLSNCPYYRDVVRMIPDFVALARKRAS